MKIFIPLSGGVNSSYALWWWLTNTAHDIYVRHFIEKFIDSDEQQRRQGYADAVAAWCGTNIRPLADYEYDDFPPATPQMEPIRPGFGYKYNWGALRPRYTAIQRGIAQTGSDGVVFGYSLENTTVDSYEFLRGTFERPTLKVYLAGSAVPDREIPKFGNFDFEAEAASMIGRMEQMAAMPQALQDVVDTCGCDSPMCLICEYHRYYVADTGDTPAEKDDKLALKGQYGKYRDLADPATYTWRNRPHVAIKVLLGEEEEGDTYTGPYLPAEGVPDDLVR